MWYRKQKEIFWNVIRYVWISIHVKFYLNFKYFCFGIQYNRPFLDLGIETLALELKLETLHLTGHKNYSQKILQSDNFGSRDQTHQVTWSYGQVVIWQMGNFTSALPQYLWLSNLSGWRSSLVRWTTSLKLYVLLTMWSRCKLKFCICTSTTRITIKLSGVVTFCMGTLPSKLCNIFTT